MGQVDCWPMQCPPIISTGVAGCTDSAGTTFADCCAPRCHSKALISSGTLTTATVMVTDPCLQQHGEHDDDNNNNNTLPPVVSKPCFYEGRTYHSGARWDDPVDMCTSCDCKVKKKRTNKMIKIIKCIQCTKCVLHEYIVISFIYTII